MISKEHRQKIIGFIQGAVNDGAEILCGGKIPKLDSKLDKGYFLEPTILGGQHVNMRSVSYTLYFHKENHQYNIKI